MNDRIDRPVGDLVCVDWVDSGMQLGSGWKTDDEFKELVHREALRATTIGFWLGYAAEDVILVAQTYDAHNDAYMNAQAIWVPAVTAVRVPG